MGKCHRRKRVSKARRQQIMPQEGTAGEDVAASTTYLAYEHPLVLEFVGKGRYLQFIVNKSVLNLYASKFRKLTAKKLTNMAAEDGSLSLLEWGRLQGCNWNASVFLSCAKGGHVELMRWMLTNTSLAVPRDFKACATAAGRGHKQATNWLRCCGFPWDAATCTAASSGGYVDLVIWAHFDCWCPWDPVEVCKVAARNHHLHILVEIQERGLVPVSPEVCAAAAEGNSLKMLRWLRERQYPWDKRVCSAAVKKGNLDILKYSLENKCPWSVGEVLPGTQESPLCLATKEDNAEMAAFLLQKCGGAPGIINLANAEGRTALSLASGNGSLSLVKLLVRAGADAEKATPEGWPPLYWAVSGNKVAVVEYLIGAGANVNFSERFSRYTPLHVCSIHNYAEVAQLLIQNGAELQRRDNEGFTPLLKATIHNSLKVVQILIDKGADLNSVDQYGRTALHRAVIERLDALLATPFAVRVADLHQRKASKPKTAVEVKLELIKKLVSAGADVNLADAGGDTPLHSVFWIEASEVIDILLKAKANPNTPDSQRITPLAKAVSINDLVLVKKLVSAGAHVNGVVDDAGEPFLFRNAIRRLAGTVDAQDKVSKEDGVSSMNFLKKHHCNPLAMAIEGGYVDVVQYLMSAGASLEAAIGPRMLLVHAVEEGSVEVIKTLGVDVNVVDDEGVSLHTALVAAGCKKEAELLMKAGAIVV